MSKICTALSLVLALAGFVACDSPAEPDSAPTAPLPHLRAEQQREAPISLTTQTPRSTFVPAAPEPSAPDDEVRPHTPELHSVDGVTLRRFVLARGVENREPFEADVAFPNEERPLFAFVDLENQTGEDRQVFVVFEAPDGTTVGHIALDVPASTPRWRTWAFSRMITEPGAWTARLLTEDGELLGQHDFEVLEQS